MTTNRTHILLVRHGATDWSRDDRFCGVTDIALSADGVAQAQRLARRLATIPITAVYCSPLRRTRQTATILAAPHQPEVVAVPELVEMNFGAWEGRLRAEIRGSDVYAAWQRDPVGITPPDGEAAYAVAARIVEAMTAIVERQRGQTILIVAHKTVNRILLCHWLGLPLGSYRDRIAQDPCALNEITIHAGVGAQIRRLNDTAHLESAGAD